MSAPLYWCARQRAGALVKERRALLPRRSADDEIWERTAKNQILRSANAAFSRTARDRLELRLALFGFEGRAYTLTFDDAHLPSDFAGVRRVLRAFQSRVKRFRKNAPWDYVYAIEGKHGAQRWHIHMVLRDSDFSPDDVQRLWRQGFAHDEPLLRAQGGYWRMASYLNKERSGGPIPLGRHPWSCSRTLSRKLPPPERWRDESAEIPIPDGATLLEKNGPIVNEFGFFVYAKYLLPKNAVPP